jgi:methionyl-tRNA synthetase
MSKVPFHTVIWPAALIGAEGDKWTKLHTVSTSEYLNYENTKFSKSRGVGVFGDGAKETGIGPSVWRYYLLSNRPETGDTQVSPGSVVAVSQFEVNLLNSSSGPVLRLQITTNSLQT